MLGLWVQTATEDNFLIDYVVMCGVVMSTVVVYCCWSWFVGVVVGFAVVVVDGGVAVLLALLVCVVVDAVAVF